MGNNGGKQEELMNSLSAFMIHEIGSKALDGITYTMLFKSEKDRETFERYKRIREQATQCGFNSDEIFRIYEVKNGYIFDMDLRVAKEVVAKLAASVAKSNGGQTPTDRILMDMPDQRRKRDMVNLYKYLKGEYNNGRLRTEVALFSRNSTNKIIITGQGPKSEAMAIKYEAYALRHWDIEALNEQFLIPANFRVKSIQPCEVLPSKTGVSFIFTMESMDQHRSMF